MVVYDSTDYDSTDHQLGDYILGQATGYSTNAWGSLGADEFRRQQAHRDASYEICHKTAGRSLGSAGGSGVLDAAGEFGSEWTETISEVVASLFSWVPDCFGWIFKLICVVAFLFGGLHYEFSGLALVAVTTSGWLVPKIIRGSLQLTLCFTLAVVYLCFMAALFVVVLGGLLGTLWGISHMLAN